MTKLWEVTPADDPPAGELTGQQATLAWPELGEQVKEHEALCILREAGGRWYVHVAEQE